MDDRPDIDSHDSLIRRRTFIVASAAAIGAIAVPRTVAAWGGESTILDDPFTLGVASGDPLANGVVIWTRLAPNPTAGGGMPPENVVVEWEVADDEAMSRTVRRGRTRARPEHGHSVHVDVRGLRPGREYWYRFRTGSHLSPIGRTRTAPQHGSAPSSLEFALVSCQRYSSGWYTAYDDIVASDPDLVVHVGDYIYESPGTGVRTDPLPESVTLDDYRNRYGLYKGDASLQAAHATAPWLFTWDDHEVENNYAGLTPETSSATPDPEQFRARRAAAYKAYWEHMPFRRRAPIDETFRIYRRTPWGQLADIFVLDTRQYRSDQCGEVGAACAPDPDRQMLGQRQQRWLDFRLRRSSADWAVLAQQVVFSRLDFAPGANDVFNLDQWDGYVEARERVLTTLRDHRPHDTIVLTGDIHSSAVSEVRADYSDPASAIMGAEFVGTSISSESSDLLNAALGVATANNAHVKWADGSQRGWVKHTVTADEWRADYRHVDDATVVGSPVQTATSWIVPRGGGPTPA